MAKKTRNATKPANDFEQELEVDYASVGVNQDTARIGVKFPRSQLSLSAADKMFVGSQLKCRMQCDPNGNDPEQGKLIDGHIELEGVAETTRLGITTSGLSTTLQFAKSAIHVEELSRFASKGGRLFCTKIGKVADGDQADPETDDDETGRLGLAAEG